MFEEDTSPGELGLKELEAVYAISRAVVKAVDTERALNDVIRLARPVFIFDNMVLYVKGAGGSLEPSYARAIGRGRFRDSGLSWGEYTATEAFQSGLTTTREEEVPGNGEERFRLRYYLGLPMNVGGEILGSLVFVRFGGPPFSNDQIHLAEFISGHVAQLLGHKRLVERIANLEARRKLDTLQDDFIATVSHELLTPLGFIKGYATTLMRDDTHWDDNTRREFLTIIDEEADRLRELIDNLMDSSRLQAGTLRISVQPMRLETLLRDVTLRARTRDEHQDIVLALNAVGQQIQGDPVRLAQVFDNLLTNAGKYAPGSPVIITLDSVSDGMRITVEDHGPGIPPEHLDSLFQRFFRVPDNSSNARGTGLGLYICRQIIQAHHGKITVESKIGQGTKFTINLPFDQPIETGM